MNYQTAGNEYISLPALRESGGAAEGATCLSMQVKGVPACAGRTG